MKSRLFSPARPARILARGFASLLVVSSLTHFASPPALAATLFWDGGTTNIAGNGDGAATGGSGTWSTSIQNWDAGASPHVAWTNANNNTAEFNTATGTITLGSNVTVGRINAKTGASGNTITEGAGAFAITLGSATTIFSNAANTTTGRTLIVNAQVTGGNNLSIVGPTVTAGGNITLGRVSTFTGTLTIAGTTLTIGTAGQLNSGNYANTISIAASGNFVYSSSLNQTLGGNITGAGKLTKGTSASSILILSGASNTYSGGTAVNAGTLTFQKTTAKPASGTVTVAAGATLGLGVATSGSFFTSANVDALFAGTLSGVTNDVASNVGIDTTQGDFTYATSVSGSPTKGLVKLGANTLTLSGTNTYTGATNITAGTILMSGSGTLGTGSALTLGGGNLELGTTSQTVGVVSVTAPAASGDTISNGSLTGTSYAASYTTGNAIISANLLVNGAAAFTKTGAGTATLSGTNTYSGGTAVNVGTLTFLNTGAKPASGTVTVAADATLGLGVATSGSFFTSADVDSLFAGTLSGVTNDAASNVGIDTTQGNFTYATSVGGSPTKGLVKLGANTLTLSGSNTFIGGVTFTAGTLELGNSGALNNTAGSENAVTFSASSTGTLALAGNSVVVTNLSTNATPGTTFVQNANGSSVANATLTVGNATPLNGTYAGTIQDGTGGGTLALTKAGTGTLTLSGTNSYSGLTTVSAGRLNANSASALGTSTVDMTGASTILSFGTGVGSVTTFANPINVTNTATGTTLIVANTAKVSLDAAISISADTKVQGTGTDNLIGTTTNGTITSGNNSNLTIFVNNSQNHVLAGAISLGTGSITRTAASNANLSLTNASNSFSGGLFIGSVGTGLGTSQSGTTSITANGAQGSGDITFIAGNTAPITFANVSGTVANNIVQTGGTGGLIKTGASTMTLTGTNTYTGATTVSAGVLDATDGTSLPSGTSILQLRGGVFQSSGTFTRAVSTAAGAVNWSTSSGGFAARGGALNLQLDGGTASLTWNGSSFVQDGQALIFGSSSADSLVDFQNAIDLGSGAVLTRTITVNDNTGSTTDIARISGAITNTTAGMGLLKNGPGILQLANDNIYTGPTTVSAGTLEISGSITGTSVQIDAAGTMLLSGTSGTQINDAATVNLNGGKFGFKDTVANQTETLGALALGASSTLDFGVGGGNDTFLFAALPTRTAGVLTIENWDGNSAGGIDGINDRLVFQGDVNDLGAFANVFGQGDVAFTGFGSGYVAIPSGTTSYEIVPVPEPSSAALLGAAALLGLVGFRQRQGLPGQKPQRTPRPSGRNEVVRGARGRCFPDLPFRSRASGSHLPWDHPVEEVKNLLTVAYCPRHPPD